MILNAELRTKSWNKYIPLILEPWWLEAKNKLSLSCWRDFAKYVRYIIMNI